MEINNINEYQELSKRTMPASDDKGKANYALGLVSEAGEVGDIIKKEIFHGHPQDRDAVKNELGDVFHYAAGLATMYGLTLQEILEGNVDKLRRRFPSGFSTADSIKRVDTL